MIDSDDFSEALCSDDSYSYMERALVRDTRRNTAKALDLQQRYLDYKNWRRTKMAKDIDKVVNLIPQNQQVSVADLKIGLKTYGFDNDYSEKIIKEAGQIIKNCKVLFIESLKNSFCI